MVKARMDHLQGRKFARQAKHWRLLPWTSLSRMHSEAIIDFTFDVSISPQKKLMSLYLSVLFPLYYFLVFELKRL
jgi:hypothetical protein